MRTVEELKRVAEKLGKEAAEGGVNTVVVVAIADIDPKTGISNYHVSYGGGLLAVTGLVEKSRTIVEQHLRDFDARAEDKS